MGQIDNMISETRELSDWFRSRGMFDNADFMELVAKTLESIHRPAGGA